MSFKKYAAAGVAVLMGTALAGCAGNPMAADTANASSTSVTIGSAAFPESELLGEIYSQALEAQGVSVKRNFDIAARDIYLAALKDGSIDLLPEYTGALYSSLVKGGAPEGVTTSDQVYKALQGVLPEGTQTLNMSAAEDKDTLAVTPATAQKYNLKSITDLAPVGNELTVGAGAGWDETYVGLVGLKKVYGIDFKGFKGLDSGGPLTLGALLNDQIQVANIYSTDASIESQKLVVLDDPKHLFAAENIVPLIRKEKATPAVSDALNSVSKALTTENLTKYLAEVTVDKKDTASVAKEFLTDAGIKH
ncbi:ABC transporter substrate-binding protein [Arthrobacter sp. 2RAF6]|uniref:ABC transporter substrate-binding protein n=1 Tax=Arthrobacter sp. 2RAF6 TaxID=3233002 RepID=UPI003F8EFAC6